MNKASHLCPSCNKKKVELFLDTEEYKYKGKTFVLTDIEFSRCKECRFEFATLKQARQIDRLARDERRKIDGLLTASDIKSIRERLNLTQKKASKIFGGGENSFSKYENSEVIQSAAMDKLLRLVSSSPAIFNIILKLSGIQGNENFISNVEVSRHNFYDVQPTKIPIISSNVTTIENIDYQKSYMGSLRNICLFSSESLQNDILSNAA